MYSFFNPRILLIVMISFVGACIPALAGNPQFTSTTIQQKLKELEIASDGRIGVSAIDTSNNRSLQYRADERFPLCSTFKVMGVSAILKKSMIDSHLLNQRVMYQKQHVVVWSPITLKHVTDGMTVSELCAAAIMYSDNTAINLLMKRIGGPIAVTAFARSIDDNIFRIDHFEPDLNCSPGDSHDTTTPVAMQKSLQQLALGNTLGGTQRKKLLTWLKNNRTGNDRIRAGVPKGWQVADKTGSGDYGTTNDIAILWPSKGKPILVAIYFTQNKKDATPRNDVIASATRLVIKELNRP